MSQEAPTNFTHTPTGGYLRTFFQGHETEWQNEVNAELAKATGDKILIGGTHGIGTDIRSFLKNTVQPANKAWVASADEVWEYYHIYNNVKIENVVWNDNTLTFDVKVPTYQKNQFRELTLNIPGLSGATACTTTGTTVYTGGWQQTNTSGVGFTMNIGLESSITTYIDELTDIYRANPNNLFVKRDAQYLIDLLWDGATKTAKQEELDRTFDYSYRVVANLNDGATTDNTKTLKSGFFDEATTVDYYFPRYILDGQSLYKTVGNTKTTSGNTITAWSYRNSLSVNAANTIDNIDYEKQTGNYVFYGEIEDVNGVSTDRIATWPVSGADVTNWNSFNGRASALASCGAGVNLQSGDYSSGDLPTVTTLDRGKYKITIGAFSSLDTQTGTYKYTLKVGGESVGTYQVAVQDQLVEYTTDEFNVTSDGQAVTINSNYNGRIYLDYLFIEQTSDTPDEPIVKKGTVTLTSSQASPMAGTTITLTATATPESGNTVTYLAIEQETSPGVWSPMDGAYGSASSRSDNAANPVIKRVASVDPTTGEVAVTYQFVAGTTGTNYNFRANAIISDGVNAPTTLLSSDAVAAGGQNQSLQLTSVPNTATTYKYHLLNASGTEVAYCENTTFGLPTNMTSPLVTNIQVWSDANKTTEYTSTTGMVFGNDYYVTYDLTTEGAALFAGGEYKIYANLNGGKYVNKASSNDEVGAWSNDYNNIWRLTGDPYSLQISMADEPTKKISFANYIDGSKSTASVSNIYNTFIILASNTTGEYILRLNEGEAYYVQSHLSVVDNGNPLTLWRTDKNYSDYSSKRFRFEKQNITTTYTYKIYNDNGTLMAEDTREQAASDTPLVPDAITSPLVTAYTYYATEAEAQTASGTPLSTVGDAISNTIYVSYTYDTDFFTHQYRINNGTNYSYAHNATVIFNTWGGNTYPHPDIWTFSGNPYSAQIHPYSNSGMTVGCSTESNGQTLSLNANPTFSHWMILGSGTNGSYQLQINNKVDNGSTTVYYNQTGNNAQMTTTETTIQIRRPVKYTFVNADNPSFDALVFFDGIADSGDALGLRSNYANRLFGIANHTTYYSDRAGNTAKTTAEAGLYEVFVRYTTDTSTLQDKGITFSTDYAHAAWMTLTPKKQQSDDRSIYLKRSGTGMATDGNADNASRFAFIGDPLRFDVVTNADTKEVIGTALTFADATGSRLWTMTTPYGTATGDYESTDPRFRIVRANGAVSDMTTLGALTPAQRNLWHINGSNNPSLWSTNDGAPTVGSSSEASDLNNIVAATVSVPVPHSTVTLSSSSVGNPVTGTTITLTATATPEAGQTVTYLAIEQETGVNHWSLVGDAYNNPEPSPARPVRKVSSVDPSTGAVTVTYEFTVGDVGTTYDFRANTTIGGSQLLSTADVASGGDGQALQFTASAVTPAYATYKFHIIDNSGNDVFPNANITVSQSDLLDDLNNSRDPLLYHYPQYCSPFVSQYLYFDTSAEAQANSGNATIWSNSSNWDGTNNVYNVYVGYTVDATKMGSDKVHAIWANGMYLHVIQNASNSHNTLESWHNAFSTQNQTYDVENVSNKDYSTGPYVQNSGISPTTLPFLDNSYMWELGTDPYNIKLKNKAYGFYHSSNAYNQSSLYIASETENIKSYCLLYWADKDWTGVNSSADYYRLIYKEDLKDKSTPSDIRTMYAWDHYFRINNDGSWATRGQMHITTLPDITLNVLNAAKEVECSLQYYFNSGATMPGNSTDGYTPFNLYRSYTSKHQWYYDAAATDAITYGSAPDASKLTANPNIYVTYTLDPKWGTSEVFYLYPGSDGGTAHWYAVRTGTNYNYHLIAKTDIAQSMDAKTGVSGDAYDTTHQEYYWAFTGTPYNLKLINMLHGKDYHLGLADANVENEAKLYLLADGTGNSTTWEMTDGLSQNNAYPFLRLQKSYNGENGSSFNPLYLSYNGASPYDVILARVAGGNQSIVLTEKTTTTVSAPSTVRLTAGSAAPYYVDSPITLTAVATPSPSGNDLVTSLVIEQETSPGVWETVTAAPAYAGSDIAGATKDPTTKAVTVTWQFTPDAAGTYTFRAHAVIDSNDQYSTDATDIGGSGSSLEIEASLQPITVGSDNYTLILVDKSGHELYTENNVPASRVSGQNSVSRRNGDPLSNDWRSPLVTRYKYYSTKEDAQTNSGSNLFDWASTATTPTVYVGYQVSDGIDLNSSSFNTLNELMTERENREGTNIQVRDASKFGKMYMLKFKMSEENYLEDGSDGVEATPTAANTIVYPYTNGDGPMYIYTDARYQSQKNNGASTRTRWPWYLVSPTGDPYHVYVTSWQNAHSHKDGDITTNYYSYLRTYYNGTKVVTNNVTDDPRTVDGNNDQLMPTEYMILQGSGTDGLNYKLVTVDAISSGADNSVASLGRRQTVTSLEQYWRNNPTAQTTVGKEKDSGSLTTEEEAQLTSLGWSKYSTYVNAKPWVGGSKTYTNEDHWYRTIQLGDGSLDIVETNIDGVLVLLDNHGWEVIRQPIVDPTDADYAAVQAALRKYDSPMVKEYKFYAARDVNHKVSGYHKYNINNDAAKCLTEKTHRVTTDNPVTSLADYPRKYDSGALADLYVTYDVKDEYTNSYVGAATEDAAAASQFVLRQGTKYAKADGATISAQDSYNTSDDTYKWKLKPNFDIDKEMGYQYDVDIDGKNTDNADHEAFLSEATTNTNYYNNQRQGFDPYNLRIQNVSTGTYFTTNATAYSNYAYEATYPGEGMKVTLTNAEAIIDAAGYDNEMLHISNATFMAVQDANGNMRLMPRFDVEHVVEGFSTLAQQAAAQPANNGTHAQTTLITTPVTYHIIDNSGDDVFGALTYGGAGFAVAHEYQSPMVAEYYYHSTLADATNSRTTSTKTTFAVGDVVYVSYKATDDFLDATKAWIIYGNKNYMHAVYRTSQSSDNSYGGRLWWMENQHKEKENGTGTEFTITTMPFLSNAFAWQVGENADPYNATFLNKGARRYMDQSNDGNSYQMGNLSFTSETHTPFAILYYSTTGDDCVLYNRTKSKYVYSSDNNNDWRAGDDRSNTEYRLTITTLPEIGINVVNAAGEVECSMEGYYKSGCTWSNSFTPFILERMYTSDHTFYYDQAGSSAISGTVNDATVTANGAVYVRYTLDTSSWGVVDNKANTLKVMPSPTNGKINWYAVKVAGQDQWFTASGTTLNLVHTGSSTATSTGDTDANKLAHWAFIGTPYNLKLVERYHGMFNYLGLSKNAVDGNFAFIDDGRADITTWEVVTMTNVSGNTNIQIRPQRSLNGETPYLYLA